MNELMGPLVVEAHQLLQIQGRYGVSQQTVVEAD